MIDILDSPEIGMQEGEKCDVRYGFGGLNLSQKRSPRYRSETASAYFVGFK